MTETFKWAFVGDLQIPYHDPRAVELFMKVCKAFKPHAIDILGDIHDALEFSSFSDGTTDEFFKQLKKEKRLMVEDLVTGEEREETDDEFRKRLSPVPFIQKDSKATKDFYSAVRKQHKNADIHASLGNHCIRVFKYVDRKAPEYNDDVTPNSLWGLDDLGITWNMYDDKPTERFGGVHVHHGVTTTTSGLGVKNDIENYDISLARGHDHRGGVVYKTYPLSGRSLVGLGAGHLCDPNAYGLRYTINPAWEQGFGIGHVVDDVPYLQFIPIRNYTCVVDGKVFKA
jgi:hypothetical protein